MLRGSCGLLHSGWRKAILIQGIYLIVQRMVMSDVSF